MEARLRQLRDKYTRDPAALKKFAEAQQEIDLYRAYPDAYGYVFYVARAAG
jgi:hypothetical protein